MGTRTWPLTPLRDPAYPLVNGSPLHLGGEHRRLVPSPHRRIICPRRRRDVAIFKNRRTARDRAVREHPYVNLRGGPRPIPYLTR
jgi:hypothetical protein